MSVKRKKSLQFVHKTHGVLRMRLVNDDNIHVYDSNGKLKFAYDTYNGWRRALNNGDFDELNDDDLYDDLGNAAQIMLWR